ncbi:MAG TPA: cytochrome c oxidase subunit II [Gemmatimonadaceae bacterium]|nr:cytochrome c oxidase subunit II [Gemmatimonadaceae bacterium]
MTATRNRVQLSAATRHALCFVPWVLAACSGFQSALDPKGPRAADVARLHWTLTSIATVVYIVVIGALLFALWRASTRAPFVDEHQYHENPDQAATMKRGVIIGLTATVIILTVFLVLSVSTGAAVATVRGEKPLRIDVVGHQWWWEVTYDDPIPQNQAKTANEIHVPVGRSVLLKMRSSDVIHSFWAPNLSGKKDLIPGHETITWFRADTAGVYRGQCAEFCGHQHAKMAFYIVAEPRLEFEKWLDHQRGPAPRPTDSLTQTGERVFLSGPCAMCHTISGTGAGGNIGPDLTHLASRRTIAAGTLPLTTGNLAGWILDPQSIKPGAKMPPNQIDPPALQALLAYLGTLK